MKNLFLRISGCLVTGRFFFNLDLAVLCSFVRGFADDHLVNLLLRDLL